MRPQRMSTAVARGWPEVDEKHEHDYCGQSAFEWSKFIGERYVEYYARKQQIRAASFAFDRLCATFGDNTPGFRHSLR